jgi:methyl-accepting chemotaxis protein
MLKNLEDLRQMKVWQKVALIAALMSLPVLIVTYLLVAERNKRIETTRLEMRGVEYLAPLRELSEDLSRRRALLNAALWGDPSQQNAAQQNRAQPNGVQPNGVQQDRAADAARAVDQRLAAVEELSQKEVGALGKSYSALFQTAESLRAVRRDWEALKGATAVPPEESFVAHTRLIAELSDLIQQVADQSALALDSEFGAHYLADAAIRRIPEASESIGQLGGQSFGVASVSWSGVRPGGAPRPPKKIEQAELTRLDSLAEAARRSANSFEQGLNSAYRYDPGLKERHGELIDAAVKGMGALIDTARQRLIRPRGAEIAPAELYSAAAQSFEGLAKVEAAAMSELGGALRGRAERLTNERNAVLGLILLGVTAMAAAAFLVARGVTRQANAITGLITELNAGNHDARADVLTKDELGQVAMAFNWLLEDASGLIQSSEERDEIQQAIMKLLDEVSGVAAGDLTREAEVTADITGAIADAFNHMITELRLLISNVQDVTRQVTSTAGETQVVTERLAQGSQQQAKRITGASEALGEMTVSIQKVSEDALESAAVADRALAAARKGAEAVQDTVKGMSRIQEHVQETSRRIKSLGERSQEIEEIVRLIEEIADRTGVLALNASIQASAAGAAGRGFAVVAAEVEQLAKRSTDATKRISNLVQAIQGGTNEAISAMVETTGEAVNGTRLASQAGKSLSEIEAVSRQLADLVKAISKSSRQQAQGSAQLSRSMAEIATVTQETASGVSQSAATVRNLAELADQLRESVAPFRLPYENGNGNGRSY